MRICCLPAGTGGVAFYRMLQPYGYLQEQGHEIFIFDPMTHDANRLHQEQMAADVIVFQCPWSEGILEAAKLIKDGKKFGQNKKVVLEFDDDLFNVSPWNEKYNIFGVNEIQITYSNPDQIAIMRGDKHLNKWMRETVNKDGSVTFDMWRDGYGGLSIKENMAKYAATAELLKIADLVTVTTAELGKKMRKFRPTGPIAVLPNLVDMTRWLPMKPSPDGEIRIGWQGGSAHFADLHMIGEQIEKIANKYPQVKFVFMGIQYDVLFQKFRDQVEWIGWHGDIATYPLVVRDMRLDIGLCPLQNDEFNNGKSPIKWVEYSAMNIATIASPVVYGNFIEHEKTGLIANSKEDWFNYMEKLILDEQYRRELANNAHQEILKSYTVEKSEMWINAISDLIKKESKILVGAY